MLYPASPHGVARLEFFDHKGSNSGGGRGGSRRLDCKVIRLAECVSVAPVTVESPPEPGATAFRLDTAQRSHLLAADAPSSAAWVQLLCRNAFPVRRPDLRVGVGQRRGQPPAVRGPGDSRLPNAALKELHSSGCSYLFLLTEGQLGTGACREPSAAFCAEDAGELAVQPHLGRCCKARSGMEWEAGI